MWELTGNMSGRVFILLNLFFCSTVGQFYTYFYDYPDYSYLDNYYHESEHKMPSAQAVWTSWSEWSKCSKTCGQGEKQRQRSCANGGTSTNCAGMDTQIESCLVKLDCPGSVLC